MSSITHEAYLCQLLSFFPSYSAQRSSSWIRTARPPTRDYLGILSPVTWIITHVAKQPSSFVDNCGYERRTWQKWLKLVSYAKQVRLTTDTVDQGPLVNHSAYNTTQRPPLEMFYGGEMISCKISIKIHYDIFRKLL